MATTADFKNGLYFKYDGKPVSIIWFQHVKPGKGPAFVKTKLRNLENGKILDRTWFSEDDFVGICGATSTPKWQLEEVANYLKNI